MKALLISHEEAGRPGVIGDILKSRGIETERHIILGRDYLFQRGPGFLGTVIE